MLSAAWRRGEETFAEVRLPDQLATEAGRCNVHPALLEPALHALVGAAVHGAGDPQGTGGRLRMPWAWREVALHAAGATSLRASFSPAGADAVALVACDEVGLPVLTATLELRETSPEQLAAGRARMGHRSLLSLGWRAVEPTGGGAAAVLDVGAVGRTDAAADAHAVARLVLEGVQAWLATDRPAEERLAIVTHGALAARPGEDVRDLAGAVTRGLVRSAQLEVPGRLVLVDTDDADASHRRLAAVLAGGEPQVALRDGEVLVPRLQIAAPPVEQAGPVFDPTRTVLVTGGTGRLGALIARHVVAAHGVRSVLLASRRGPDAEGAAQLAAELESLGAHVAVRACDVGDRDAVRALLEHVPVEWPLGAVVHAAAVGGSGLIESLAAEGVDAVLRPKVDGAWHLHELTAGLELSAFVLCSSAAGVAGDPGAAHAGAANTFLDALAAHRRAQGLRATSIAWGLWQQEPAEDSRPAPLTLLGLRGLTTEEGLQLLDLACAGADPLRIALRLDFAALREQAREGLTLPLLAELVQTSVRRASEHSSGSLAARLAGVPAPERQAVVLAFLRGHLAAVLGRSDPEGIDVEATFQELGFDSLGAVYLRNRLMASTGLQLPATLVLGYPTPAALAAHLIEQLVGPGESPAERVRALGEALAGGDLDEEERAQLALRLRAMADELQRGGRDDGEGVAVASVGELETNGHDSVNGPVAVPVEGV